jgi:LL-diaminopimelate aminotransferase
VAAYYKRRFGVTLDPETEVIALLGSKEGIAHMFFALVNDCDFTLVPDPQYPVYQLATSLTGGVPFHMPLTEKTAISGLFQDSAGSGKKEQDFFLNYPNNPTGAVAGIDFTGKL